MPLMIGGLARRVSMGDLRYSYTISEKLTVEKTYQSLKSPQWAARSKFSLPILPPRIRFFSMSRRRLANNEALGKLHVGNYNIVPD